jgi:hypothetical protein
LKRVLADKPVEIAKDNYLDEVYRNITADTKDGWIEPPSYNVLQVTDWHIDLDYLEGTSTTCK